MLVLDSAQSHRRHLRTLRCYQLYRGNKPVASATKASLLSIETEEERAGAPTPTNLLRIHEHDVQLAPHL